MRMLRDARMSLEPLRESVNNAMDAMFGYTGINAGDEYQ